MCDFIVLARVDKHVVRWCKNCETYSITYNNIVANFSQFAFENFSQNVDFCYQQNMKDPKNVDKRDIFFNTSVDGIQFLFSTREVGTLLRLIQEAKYYLELVHGIKKEDLN